ncbi:MAG: copper transporter [Coriobacteriales bacterium]|jgi:hypothetical protein|nr:copper transporter [Coriobacteriales bacterium]
MYNFRYHLVTICSIFLALVLGLLIGVAIGGSELARGASEDLVDSLMTQFDDLRDENSRLSKELEAQTPFSQTLVEGWKADRLEGRVIVVLCREDESSKEIGRFISESGGIPVYVTVTGPHFGLANEAISSEIASVVPAVEGESYDLTLVRALVDEWSYSYRLDDGEVKQVFSERYPLTLKLVSLDCIRIEVDYGSYIERLTPEGAGGIFTDRSSLMALTSAQEQQLPYSANGLVDMVSWPEISSIPRSEGIALLMAHEFIGRGEAEKLSLIDLEPGMLEVGQGSGTGEEIPEGSGQTDEEAPDATGAIPKPPLAGTPQEIEPFEPTEKAPSYFAVLVHEGEYSSLSARAEEEGLPCVISPSQTGSVGNYSLIALFSGGETGVYGVERTATERYPPLPSDLKGNAAF